MDRDDPPLTVVDGRGRNVTLTSDRWRHVVEGHPELGVHRDAVLATVEAPDHTMLGPRPGEEWVYRERLGPSRWLKVVVAYANEEGRIITAFARRRRP